MKYYIMILLSILWTCSYCQAPGFGVSGIGSIPVPATSNKMTNLIFPAPVQTAVKVSRDILVQKVRGIGNVIELKAVRYNFPETNLTVYGMDGQIYSFVVRFSSDSNVLNFRILADSGCKVNAPVQLATLPSNIQSLTDTATKLATLPPFLHVKTSEERMTFRLKGIYMRSGLEWLAFELANQSQIPFQLADLRFAMVDKKEVKRKAIQEKVVDTVFANLPPVIEGESHSNFAVGFRPFAVPKGKRLLIELGSADGGRTLFLRVRRSLLVRAR